MPSVIAAHDIASWSRKYGKYGHQWISGGSTRESEHAKEVWRAPLLITKTQMLVQNPRDDRIEVMTTIPLTREQAVQLLVASEPEIRALGVERLALFGSVLHGNARPDSDIDLLVQFSPGAKTFDRFLALCELLEGRLGRRVELVTTEALTPFIGPRILAEAQDVLRAA